MTSHRVWTDERIAEMKQGRAAGLSLGQIGKSMGVSRSAIAGIAYRLRFAGNIPGRKPTGQPRKRIEGHHDFEHWANLEPARYPYAPDCSDPDFAWDDAHCEAVNDRGGFPALQFRRRA